MSDTPEISQLPHDAQEPLEERLHAAGRAFVYPPTPQVSLAVSRRLSVPRRHPARRLALAGLLLALLLAAVFSVPPVRAAVLDWIHLGAVRIFLVQPSSTPLPTPLPGTPTAAVTATPAPTLTPLPSVLDLSGETSLADAQAQAGFPILLPAAPADLGQPQHVFFQDMGGPVVVLVWMQPASPESVRLVLSETSSDNIIFQKLIPKSVQDTQVNGQAALWVDAPYLLVTGSGQTTSTRLIIDGHTLVWTSGKFTFRLETGSDLATAVRVAEFLQ